MAATISSPGSIRGWRQRRQAAQNIDAVAAAVARHLRVPGTDRPLVPYREQRLAARAMLRGAVAEMATGEGKTVAAALAAGVLARERPVHIATANGYLAARDAGLLRAVYADLGLTTGVILSEMAPAERRRQYGCDIVYSTLSEFGFDYLRDRLVLRPDDRVQARGLGVLLVDEADLLLVDEARTPLVIARARTDPEEPDLPRLAIHIEALVAEQQVRLRAKLEQLTALQPESFDAAVLAAQLRRGGPSDPAVAAFLLAQPWAARAADRAERELRGPGAWMLDHGLLYSVDERSRTAYLTDDGQRAVEERLGLIFERPESEARTIAALHSLVLAYALFRRDHEYLVRDGRIVLIEEATGRAAESRRYQHGLHAAIEVKELGAPLEETETRAQISVQQFVRQYARRAGMTGTAMPAAEEFARIYEMQVVRIPRHQPNRRVDLPPRLYRTVAEVNTAVVEAIAAAHALGRPVLCGTLDVARSERLSRLLGERNIEHVVLNAREHAREAAIIAEAGRFGAVTIATNMAGRGADIRLETGLTERLVARAAQVARERLMSGPVTILCASRVAAGRLRNALAAAGFTVEQHGILLKLRQMNTGDSAAAGGYTHEAGPERGRTATSSPGEGQAPALFFALGLEVIAVEPGTSRRIDDQLRGRSGRQGDEGVTRLFASLEDEALRYYGDPRRRVAALRSLKRTGVMQGRAAARVIGDAQRRAERMHAGARRSLFEFDQVIEAQRKAMLAAYDRALVHPAPEELMRGLLTGVAAWEWEARPADAVGRAQWEQEVTARYGLPGPVDETVDGSTGVELPWGCQTIRQNGYHDGIGADKGRALQPASWKGDHPGFAGDGWSASQRAMYGGDGNEAPPLPAGQRITAGRIESPAHLEALLRERFERMQAETGDRWREVARSALLRAAAERWAAHVEAVDQLARQSPSLYAFLPGAAVIPFAKEASRWYTVFLRAVRSEAVADLLTLPQPYERPLPPRDRPALSPVVRELLDMVAVDADVGAETSDNS